MPADTTASITRHSLSLGLFGLVAAIILATVHALTADRIQEQQLAAERRALAEIFPAGLHDNDLLAAAVRFDAGAPSSFQLLDVLTLQTPRPGYIARRNGVFTGAVIPVDALDGYSGTINLLVGIGNDGRVTGVRVTEHHETPGLGDKIDANVSNWIFGFDGTSLTSPALEHWKVTKDGGDFDALTGATITPRAVVGAVYRALEYFRAHHDDIFIDPSSRTAERANPSPGS